MRLFNPSVRPRLCAALQEVLFPFEDREVASEWEEHVRNCPLGEACECERSEPNPEPDPKSSSKRSVKANEPDGGTKEDAGDEETEG